MFDLAQHYRREIELADFTLRYEDFARHPEEETRRLLDYLELPFEPACLAFHERQRYAATPSYAQVTEKVHERSVNRHRNYLGYLGPHVRPLAPWLTALGYDPIASD